MKVTKTRSITVTLTNDDIREAVLAHVTRKHPDLRDMTVKAMRFSEAVSQEPDPRLRVYGVPDGLCLDAAIQLQDDE